LSQPSIDLGRPPYQALSKIPGRDPKQCCKEHDEISVEDHVQDLLDRFSEGRMISKFPPPWDIALAWSVYMQGYDDFKSPTPHGIHKGKMIEGSLEVKLPTIWTDEKQSREEAERRERFEERRLEEKE